MEHIFQRKLEGSPSDGLGTNCTFAENAETIAKFMFQPDLQRTRAICGPGAGYLRDVGWSATSLYVLFAFPFLIAALSISVIKLHRLAEENAVVLTT
ncbi:MAG: hypothetical protein IIB73_11635 [Proteobacteria bacterium]|nr:hypothetical protein [Pseudomonadota bacterium]